jgi:hypothetical protein
MGVVRSDDPDDNLGKAVAGRDGCGLRAACFAERKPFIHLLNAVLITTYKAYTFSLQHATLLDQIGSLR